MFAYLVLGCLLLAGSSHADFMISKRKYKLQYAAEYCNRRNGNLVSLRDRTDYEALLNWLFANDHANKVFWMGMKVKPYGDNQITQANGVLGGYVVWNSKAKLALAHPRDRKLKTGILLETKANAEKTGMRNAYFVALSFALCETTPRICTTGLPIGKYTFKVSDKKLSYGNAKDYCGSVGGTLAYQDLNTWLGRKKVAETLKLPDNNAYWMGLDKLSGRWKWIDGRYAKARDMLWYIHAPHSTNHRCGYMHTNKRINLETKNVLQCGQRGAYALCQTRCRVNGGFTEWTSWTQCSKKCGDGYQSRERQCSNPLPSNGGVDCTGLGSCYDVRPCNNNCPVDGGYSDWFAWSKCSAPCGTGNQFRGRKCTNPYPRNGGADCSRLGPPAQFRDCNTKPCELAAEPEPEIEPEPEPEPEGEAEPIAGVEPDSDGLCPIFIEGDMTGPESSEMLVATGKTQAQCLEICTKKKKKNPTINGVTVTAGGGKCYCEMGGTNINGNIKWETCYL